MAQNSSKKKPARAIWKTVCHGYGMSLAVDASAEVYSTAKLREEVEGLGSFFATNHDSIKKYFPEQVRQMKVWRQALDNNDDLKANADSYPGTGHEFYGDAIGPVTYETTIATSMVKHIDTELAVEGSFGAELGLEVAGSGGTLGATVTARMAFGSSASATNANSVLCSAIYLPFNGGVQPGFSNNLATATPGEQAIAPPADCTLGWCESTMHNTVWFKFVAPASGKVEVSTCGLAEFDTQLAVYKSTDCANFGTFTLVGANDDGPTSCATGFDSRLEIAGLVSGTTYWAMVDGWDVL